MRPMPMNRPDRTIAVSSDRRERVSPCGWKNRKAMHSALAISKVRSPSIAERRREPKASRVTLPLLSAKKA